MSNLIIDRSYLPSGDCTIGKLTTSTGWFCYTMERPWLDNQNSISCIPEGTYKLHKRYSPIVNRTSRGEFTEGWEITNVVDRTYIMFHVANWATTDLEGCVGVGDRIAWTNDKGFMVTNSIDTFRKFMEKLSVKEEWNLIIRKFNP